MSIVAISRLINKVLQFCMGLLTLIPLHGTGQCVAIPAILGGTGNYCIGDPVTVGIPNTIPGQDYIWFLNNKPVARKPAADNGGSVSFNFPASGDLSGQYYVKAIKPGCNPAQFGNVTVNISGPQPQKITGGTYCGVGDPVNIVMESSQMGVSYTLNHPNGSITINGTGSAINFGAFTALGTYDVLGTGLGCFNAKVASTIISNVAKIPFSQNFNTSASSVYPNCWTLGSPIVGTSGFTFESTTANPVTIPYEGSRFMFWNSRNSATHPIGNESRIIYTVDPVFATVIDISFYWYNNNNPSYNTGRFLNEGVQVQYFNSGWINIGNFIPRHDGSLPVGTGQWKKKTITLNTVPSGPFVLAFKFRSENGDNCSMDSVSINTTPGCQTTSSAYLYNVTPTTAQFVWNKVPGSNGYEYAVTQTSTPPASGTTTTDSFALFTGLASGKKLYFHVRTMCSAGIVNWSTQEFYTAHNCATAPVITPCSNFGVTVPIGTGLWNFNGTYPNNSTGIATVGGEQLFRFTPASTGVYYLQDMGGGSYIEALYKPSISGCTDTGWTGIMNSGNNKRAIGLLQAGIEYLFVFDGRYESSGVGTFRICKATVGAPSVANQCNSVTIYQEIAAGSTKEEFIIDDNGNLIASLDFSQLYGINYMEAGYYVNTANVRRDNTNKEYLDRNFYLSYDSYSTNPVKVKLFFTNAELQKLIDQPNDNIADITALQDLHVTQLNQYCSETVGASIGTFIPQSSSGNFDPNFNYIEFTSTTNIFSAFLHGGNLPLNYTCPQAPASYPALPITEGFNIANPTVLPPCWREEQGGSQVSFQATSVNPGTIPFEGSQYVFYNSYNFPAGSYSRLVAPVFKTTGISSTDVEFYWYNNNNPSYTSNIEGVQVEYSLDGFSWTPATYLFARHDASLPQGTGRWNKKRVTLPAITANKSAVYVSFVFFSQYGDNCAMDAVRIVQTPPCPDVNDLKIVEVTGTTVSFKWAKSQGVTQYQYAVTYTSAAPASWTQTTDTAVTANLSYPYTTYYLHVRPVCSPGIFGNWNSLTFDAGINCTTATTFGQDTYITAVIPAGSGNWNMSGTYPVNSIGYNTRGKEIAYRFVPTETGVYYMDVLSTNQRYVDYFYKEASGSCKDSGWIGISDIFNPGKVPIGMLQAGTTYLILLDPEGTNGASQTFRIRKATTLIASLLNTCIGPALPTQSIPALSPKTEYIIDGVGNLIASLDFSQVTNPVGQVQISYNINSNAIRRDKQNKEYLDRNLTIRADQPPVNPIKVRYYFTVNDLQRLVDEPNDGIADVASINDLKITSSYQECSNIMEEGNEQLLTQSANGTYDINTRFIEFATDRNATFYFHGGNQVLVQDVNNPFAICQGTTSFYLYCLAPSMYHSFQWEVNTGAGFIPISDNANYSGSNTSTLLVTASSTFTGYQFRCKATFGTNAVISNIRTVRFEASWTGAVNTTWNNPLNWSCSLVPDENTEVIIPAGLSNYPVVASPGATCRKITVKQGATITISTNIQLTITGK